MELSLDLRFPKNRLIMAENPRLFSFQDLKAGTFDLPKNAKRFICKGFHQ
ncbi:hypothetical protein [Okeania sp.]|nr:hypothetical protein [Okeania sp.]MEB3340981.1 hypothetical protein [Okeania sp.]